MRGATVKFAKPIFTLAVILLGTIASGAVLAHHHRGHVHFGVFVGAPAFWYYPPPYYYYPPVVVAPASPPVYVEQNDPPAPPRDTASYWYYCPDTKSYYPYVNECASSWQQVVPHAPNS